MKRRAKKRGMEQPMLPFGKVKRGQKKPVGKKSLSREEIKAAKERALRLASQAYAVIRSPEAGRIFKGVNPQHIELYRKEFGRDIGELRKGRVSARQAQEVISRAKAFFDRFNTN